MWALTLRGYYVQNKTYTQKTAPNLELCNYFGYTKMIIFFDLDTATLQEQNLVKVDEQPSKTDNNLLNSKVI